MSQRIFNLSKWCYLPEGSTMPFPNRRRRNVVLEVNSEGTASLYVVQEKEAVDGNPEKLNDEEAGRPRRTILPKAAMWGDEETPRASAGHVATFLCSVGRGRDTIDFAVDGAFDLLAVGGDVHIYSQDSLQHEVHVLDPLVFTRIANRRQRNPQLEMMMWQQRQNMERRLNALAEDAERRIVAAEKGARERYAKERDVRAADSRRVSGGTSTRQVVSPGGSGDDVRTERPDHRQGESGSGVAGQEGVSPASGQSRGKVKSPA